LLGRVKNAVVLEMTSRSRMKKRYFGAISFNNICGEELVADG
jgi:hypothetical protein